MATNSAIGCDSSIANSPWWLRFFATGLAAICCGTQVVVPVESYYSTVKTSTNKFEVYSDHGWPLPAIRLIREATDDPAHGEGKGKVSNYFVAPVTDMEFRVLALLYDIGVIVSMVTLACLFFLPWRAFPRPKFSLADVYVLMGCLTVGSVLWYRMCVVGSGLWQDRQDLLGINTACYLIISLVSAGTLNGIIVHLSWWARRRAAVAKGAPHGHTECTP